MHSQKLQECQFFQTLTVPYISEIECIKKRATIAYIINNSFSTPKHIIQSLVLQPQIHSISKLNVVNSAVQTDPLRGTSSDLTLNPKIKKTPSRTFNSNVNGLYNKYSLIEEKKENMHEKQQTRKQTITILSDSHGRKLDQLLKEKCDNSVEIKSILRPGAGIDCIMEESRHIVRDKNNHVILIAGANDIYKGQTDSLCKKLKSLVMSLRPCKVTIASIPFRHDLYISD